MKQKLLLLTLLFSISGLFAQQSGDVTFYSNTGKKFYVVLNGIRQNTQAETNINVSGLTDSWYSCRLIAEDKSFNIEKNIGVKKDSLVTYRITEKKGKYKLRYYSESPLRSAPPSNESVNIVYHSTETPTEHVQLSTGNMNVNTSSNSNTNVSSNSNTNVSNGNMTTNTTMSTNSSTNVDPNGTGGNFSFQVSETGTEGNENVDVNIQFSGTGMDMDVNDTQGNSTYQETTTVTTSSSTTTTINGHTTYSEEYNSTTTTNNNGEINTHNDSYSTSGETGNLYTDDDMTMTFNSSGGCATSPSDIKAIKASINEASFSEDKMIVAKQVAKNKCMTVAQIKEIAVLFDFDDDRMQFVKAAHLNCMNQGDYYQLMEIFTFDTDKKELESFLNGK